MRMKLKAALLTMMLIPTGAHSQQPEMIPLSQHLKLPDDRKDKAYPFVRCVGLFRGMFRYGGANFSDEMTAQTDQANNAMLLVAFFVRKEKHQNSFSEEDIAGQLGTEVEALEVIYADRMTQNYSQTGEAWGSDAIISDDFETCGAISQAAVGAISGN